MNNIVEKIGKENINWNEVHNFLLSIVDDKEFIKNCGNILNVIYLRTKDRKDYKEFINNDLMKNRLQLLKWSSKHEDVFSSIKKEWEKSNEKN